MDRSKAYSSKLYQASALYEKYGCTLRDLADTLVETATILRSFAYDAERKAFLARKASYESQSFSFDFKPSPTDQQCAAAVQRLKDTHVRAHHSEHCSEVIHQNLIHLISHVKDEGPQMSKETQVENTKVWKKAARVQHLFREEEARAQVQQERQEQRRQAQDSDDSQVSDDHSTVADSDVACFDRSFSSCFPLSCQDGHHVPTCSNVCFGTAVAKSRAKSNFAAEPLGHSHKRPAHVAFRNDSSTLVEASPADSSPAKPHTSPPHTPPNPRTLEHVAHNPAHRTSLTSSERSKVAVAVSAMTPAQTKKTTPLQPFNHPLLKLIPERVPVLPSTILGSNFPLSPHPYGF